MKEHGRISQIRATYDLGITRLGARIWDLKRLGIEIRDEMIYKTDEHGEHVRWKEYWLA